MDEPFEIAQTSGRFFMRNEIENGALRFAISKLYSHSRADGDGL